MLCSEELNGLTGALQMVDEVPAAISTSSSSASIPRKARTSPPQEAQLPQKYGHPDTASGWHFMTGTQPTSTRSPRPSASLRQNPRSRWQAHPVCHASSIQIVTPKASWRSTTWASSSRPRISASASPKPPPSHRSPVDNILTYCYHYDPKTNKHSLIVAALCNWAAS